MIVLFCIAKLEHLYIEEFCNHHLSIGFDAIYIYDNEDVPTYHRINLPKVNVIHFPGKVMQYKAMEHFTQNIMPTVTHVIHMDCDEFIALKKHETIQQFVQEYIKGDCVGIGINWRFFGDSHKTFTNEPLRKRFTWCQRNGDRHIKTLFQTASFLKYNTVHDIVVKGHIKSTNGTIIKGPWNDAIDLSVIQINHYKTKTLEEFIYIRQRGRADIASHETREKILESFHAHNFNEVEDLTLFNKMV